MPVLKLLRVINELGHGGRNAEEDAVRERYGKGYDDTFAEAESQGMVERSATPGTVSLTSTGRDETDL